MRPLGLTLNTLALYALSCLLIAAFAMQFALNELPCPLCLEQRYAYYLAIPIGALVAFAAVKDTPRSVLLAGLVILAAAALGNAWLGAYHAGVEWQFWQGPTDCSGPVVDLGSAGNLRGECPHFGGYGNVGHRASRYLMRGSSTM